MQKNIIIGPAYPLRGGIANLNEALCENFNKQNIKSSIVSFSLQYPQFLFPGKTQFESSVVKHDFEIKTIINSINPLSWFVAANYIIKQKPDCVIIRYWLPFMAPCLGTIARMLRRKRIKVIAIADNIIPHEGRFGDKFLTNYFVNSCDGFIVMSKKVQEDIRLFNERKPVLFTPHPIYNIFGEAIKKKVAINKLSLSPDNKYILFFGFIRKYKGLDLLIEAMSMLPDKKIKLIVAGEFYEDKKEYLNIIEKHNLHNNIIISDSYISKEEVKNYFSASDLVVQPYRDATQSGVTQIAYSFNKPMLVTNVGGLPEIVTHLKSGYVVEPNSEKIADAINDYYSNDREVFFSKGVEEEKKRFGWDVMIEKIEELYEKI
jgi:glycosyltransferase involved in cell wall biosynthesis